MSKPKFKNRYLFKDYSGQDLSKQDLQSSEFIACNFTDSDLSHADCSHCDFTGSILERTKCTGTNFANSCLACTFHPSDCLGMTLTLNCRTFSEMRISRKWWYSFLFFAIQMKPDLDDGEDLRTKLEEVFDKDRLSKLKNLFNVRQI